MSSQIYFKKQKNSDQGDDSKLLCSKLENTIKGKNQNLSTLLLWIVWLVN